MKYVTLIDPAAMAQNLEEFRFDGKGWLLTPAQGTKTTSESAAMKEAARLEKLRGVSYRILKIQELFGKQKVVYIPLRQGRWVELWLKHIADAWYLELIA